MSAQISATKRLLAVLSHNGQHRSFTTKKKMKWARQDKHWGSYSEIHRSVQREWEAKTEVIVKLVEGYLDELNDADLGRADAAFVRTSKAASTRTRRSSNPKPVVPQKIRWGPSNARPAGIRVFDEDGVEGPFVPWLDLRDELISQLLPQLFDNNPLGFTFRVEDFGGKKDWIVTIFDAAGNWYCDVWFGGNPDRGFEVDWLLHVGHRNAIPRVWHTYRRYSDGTYQQLLSRSESIDELKMLMDRQELESK
jgi:hypothetical protein